MPKTKAHNLLRYLKFFKKDGKNIPDGCTSSEIVICYTEILRIEVVLWCFFMSEASENIHNSTFGVKISV